MTKSSVAIIGKSRLADELLALAQDKGLEATHLTDATAVASTTNFVIDSETGAEDKKRARAPAARRLSAGSGSDRQLLLALLDDADGLLAQKT